MMNVIFNTPSVSSHVCRSLNVGSFYNQSGATLLEILVAIVIFSIGMLGILGLQANTVNVGADARYRTEAAALADELIGKAFVWDRATLEAQFESPGGAEFQRWLTNRVTAAGVGLPGGEATVDIIPTAGGNPNAGFAINVRITWKAPSATAISVYETFTAVPGST